MPVIDIGDFDGTFVMAEGRKPNFNCDGKNHYFYIVDKSARRPDGKSYSRGRIYGGTIEIARQQFPTLTRVWETVIHPRNNPNCPIVRANQGTGSDPGRSEAVRVGRGDAENAGGERQGRDGAGDQVE